MTVSEQKLIESIVGAAILFRHKLTQSHRAILFQQVDALERLRATNTVPGSRESCDRCRFFGTHFCGEPSHADEAPRAIGGDRE